MIDPKLVREAPDRVKAMLEARNSKADLEGLIRADGERRATQVKVDALRADKNRLAEEYGKMAREGKKGSPAAAKSMEEMKRLDEELKGLEETLTRAEAEYDRLVLTLPNFPHESVPVGKSAADNKQVKSWGEPRKFGFKAKPHWELGESLGLLDLGRAAKIAGSRFPLFTGRGARIVRGLINFMLDLHTTKHGYTEVSPPVLVNADSMRCTGQLPLLDEDMFRTREPDAFYLVPTAEVCIVNIHRDEILDGAKLPIKYVGYTQSFRRESGSYGKEIRGIIRQHQFDKVEMIQFVKPEDSLKAHEEMAAHSMAVLEALGLPYRLMLLCTAEMSQASMKTYDPELWMPGMNAWIEIASVSTCSDYQARRGQIRFRREPNAKAELVHILNGSGVAVGRCFAALLENYQREDGSIEIPSALQSFVGGLSVISK